MSPTTKESAMTLKQRKALTKKMWLDYSPAEIAIRCKVARRTIIRYAREMGLPKYVEPSIDMDVTERQLRTKLQRERRKSKQLIQKVVDLEAQVEVKHALSGTAEMYKIHNVNAVGTQAIAVVLASDWHIEEVCNPATIGGLNSFNEIICLSRVQRFFRHTVKLLKLSQTHTHIDTLILALLGDFISGSIHDELVEINRLSPTFAIIECQNHLASGIRYILDNTDVNLIIPCHSGNHGRMVSKNRHATEQGNSLERLMYHSLSLLFKNEPRVTFLISESYLSYVEVWDNFTIRFHHGHQTKYYGGVGGLSIPMNKSVAQWDKARRANLTCLGHYHNLLYGGNWVVNGSLIGYNAYALAIKASPEPPQQAFFLIDQNVGTTMFTPIILTEDR